MESGGTMKVVSAQCRTYFWPNACQIHLNSNGSRARNEARTAFRSKGSCYHPWLKAWSGPTVRPGVWCQSWAPSMSVPCYQAVNVFRGSLLPRNPANFSFFSFLLGGLNECPTFSKPPLGWSSVTFTFEMGWHMLTPSSLNFFDGTVNHRILLLNNLKPLVWCTLCRFSLQHQNSELFLGLQAPNLLSSNYFGW